MLSCQTATQNSTFNIQNLVSGSGEFSACCSLAPAGCSLRSRAYYSQTWPRYAIEYTISCHSPPSIGRLSQGRCTLVFPTLIPQPGLPCQKEGARVHRNGMLVLPSPAQQAPGARRGGEGARGEGVLGLCISPQDSAARSINSASRAVRGTILGTRMYSLGL